MRRLGLAALAALPVVLLTTGCDPQCVDNWDCNYATTGDVCYEHQCKPATCSGSPATITCKSDQICDTGDGKCKACLADNSNCDPGLVCDVTNDTCVECLGSTNCSGATPYCNTTDNTCKTCLADNSGCTSPAFCDTTRSGGLGQCVHCNAASGCTAPQFCDTTAASGVGACVNCKADDTGCSGGAPVCNTAGNGGAGACVQCLAGETAACTGSTPVCDTTAHVCKTCLDNAGAGQQDQGCTVALPICKAGGNGACVQCVADGDCASGVCDTTTNTCKTCLANDHGCEGTPATPACDTAASSGAGACVQCTATTTTACTGSTLVCDTTNHACKTCLDSAAAGQQDQGCTAGSPICDTAANSGAGQCLGCLGNTDCSGSTLVCDTAGTQTCKTCLADNTGCTAPLACNASGNGGLGICYGCTGDNDCTSSPTTPHCNTGVTPGTCVECTDTTTPVSAHCTNTAPICSTSNHCGCSSSTQCAAVPSTTAPVCDTAASGGNGTCVVCTATEGCTTPTPLCKPDQTACVQCLSNADCSVTENCDGTGTCVSANPGATSTQISGFNTGTTTSGPLSGAVVTYIRPGVGLDPGGFFVQAEQAGPATFVEALSGFTPAVGDRVNLAVLQVDWVTGVHALRLDPAGTNAIESSGHPVSPLLTNVTGVDLSTLTAQDQYESKYVTITGTVTVPYTTGGTGNYQATMLTTGTTAGTSLKFRMSEGMLDATDANFCTGVALTAGPFWRYKGTTGATTGTAEPMPFAASDFTLTGCAVPKAVRAASTNANAVVVTFDQHIDAGAVLANGSQFTLSDGTNPLAVTGATVNGKYVTLTTAGQTAGTTYTVTVGTGVNSVHGVAVGATSNTATFLGYRGAAASVLVNEVHPTIVSGQDLVELYVTSGGWVGGMRVEQDITPMVAKTLITLPDATVQTGDLIIVHLNTASTNETGTKADNTAAEPTAFANAWDFFDGAAPGTNAGFTYSGRVVTVRNALDAVADAVPFWALTPPGVFADQLADLNRRGLWNEASCTIAASPWATVCNAASTPTWTAVAVSWASPAANVTYSATIVTPQRNTTTNTTPSKAYWTAAPITHTFGVLNAGE